MRYAQKKIITISILILLLVTGCSKKEDTEDSITKNSALESSEQINELDRAIELVISEKYDEGLIILEKLNIKKYENKEVQSLIKQINLFKEAQQLEAEEMYDEATSKYQLIIGDSNGFETLRNNSKKNIDKLATLVSKKNKIVSMETFSNYIDERNELKKYSTNPSAIDLIPDSQFKKIYDDRADLGIKDTYNEDLINIFSELYPDAQLNLNQLSENSSSSEIDAETAKELVINDFENAGNIPMQFSVSDQGEYFMVYGQPNDPALQSMATNIYYHVYKSGEIRVVDRNGN
ncbi:MULTISPECIES: hypothetical protein [Carnobacterium]|nr:MULTISPECIES: hypothetical protein [Carnobacterium]TFJ69180.1 hypothetical protein CKN94_16560 [Carnobacterium maltaromaticum]TFJ75721.1 hypothetical protein CKN97_16550 [Carnobacterium maltaromaticum]